MRRVAFILAVLAGAVRFSSLLHAAASSVLYVAATGSDSWSGRLAAPNSGGTDGPLATLEAARAAARKLGKEQPRKIVVQPGRYFLDKTLVLTDEDTGLTIESAPDAGACLIGGRMVTGWKKDGERFYSTSLPGVKEGKWDFRTLTVNGRYCRPANCRI